MPCDHFKALNLAKDGKWDAAHREVQPFFDELSCLIHAYLHRVEGDFDNAKYWYRRIGVEIPNNSLLQELQRLLKKAQGEEPLSETT